MADKKTRKVSVVIPICNEEAGLPDLFTALEGLSVDEVIMVDCGSSDASWSLLQKWSCEQTSRYRRRISSSLRGRGKQMNAGAKLATGEILLFLHADSHLPLDGIESIRRAMKQPSVVGGAFHLQIDSPHPFLKFISYMANLRSLYLKLPYGDQGYFVRRDCFEQLGGFKVIALMEDVDFFRRLKEKGEVVLLKEAVTTSARRWRDQGYFFTSVRNMILFCLYLLGVSPNKLARWYYP